MPRQSGRRETRRVNTGRTVTTDSQSLAARWGRRFAIGPLGPDLGIGGSAAALRTSVTAPWCPISSGGGTLRKRRSGKTSGLAQIPSTNPSTSRAAPQRATMRTQSGRQRTVTVPQKSRQQQRQKSQQQQLKNQQQQQQQQQKNQQQRAKLVSLNLGLVMLMHDSSSQG